MLWQEFSSPIVRDLAWAGFSSPLLRIEHYSTPELPVVALDLDAAGFWHTHLAALDHNPSPLLEYVQGRNEGRLGLYFERLWQYLLEKDPATELVAHNLPVRDGGRTLGEFDSLYWCSRRSTYVHLELAVKYYLGVPGSDVWLGPGGKDRLDAKLQHLLQRQIRLSRSSAGKSVLSELGIDSPLLEIGLRGYLFAPADAGNESALYPGNTSSLPEACTDNTYVGVWYKLEEFLQLEALPENWMGWYWLPRRHWLSAFRWPAGTHRKHGEIHNALRHHFQQRRQPALLAACDQYGEERRRCFVTGPGWPGRDWPWQN